MKFIEVTVGNIPQLINLSMVTEIVPLKVGPGAVLHFTGSSRTVTTYHHYEDLLKAMELFSEVEVCRQ